MVTVAILTIACMNLYGTYRLTLNIKDDAAPYIAVANYIKNKPSRTIYIHHSRWSLFLNYFLRYNPHLDFRRIDHLEPDEIRNISNAYVIMHKRYIEADVRGRAFKYLPFYARYVDSPPPNWIKALSFHGRPEYNNMIMYYVR